MATKNTKAETDGVDLKDSEKRAKAKNPLVVTGSARKETKGHHEGRITVEIKCCDCKARRRIATSDVHQTTRCEEHAKAEKLRKRREAGSKSKPVTKQKATGTKTKPVKKASKVKSGGIKARVAAKQVGRSPATKTASVPAPGTADIAVPTAAA